MSMRAWVVRTPRPLDMTVGAGPLTLADLPVPEPGPGEVRLRVLACGVCHTDLHIAEGDLPLRRGPVVPGHQLVGVVDAAGPGTAHPPPGTLVGVTWLAGACGTCAHCRAGAENLCPDAQFTGYDRDGGYAEYAVVRAGYAHPIPAGLDPLEAAPLLCAGVIGYRSLRRAEVAPGSRLGLIGFGASAHLALQVARHWGCEVYVFTRSRHHREQARRLGAAWAGGIEDKPPAPCHSQILFAPAGDLVPRCLPHLAPGGTLAINAVHMSDIPGFPYDLLFQERTVRSVSHVTREDAAAFLPLAARIPLRPQVEVYPFDQAPAALLSIKRSQVTGAAVLQIPS